MRTHDASPQGSRKWEFWSRPDFVDARDLISFDAVGKRAGANAINIAAAVDEVASRLNGIFGSRVSNDVVATEVSVLDVPRHCNRLSSATLRR